MMKVALDAIRKMGHSTPSSFLILHSFPLIAQRAAW
jgi:hypothetical protein